jgi:flagellar protein FlbD
MSGTKEWADPSVWARAAGKCADGEKGDIAMVALTRLNGHRFFVNCDLIKYSEAAPDTVLALVNGEKVVVTESPEQVMQAILAYRAEVLRMAWPEAASALKASCAQRII